MEGKENSYSPTGVLEDYFRTEESEIVSSRASTSEFENRKNTKSSSGWHGFLELLKIKSKKPLPALHPLSVMKLSKRLSSSMREYVCTALNPLVEGDLRPRWKNFTLSELQSASNYFSKDNLIGKGGYAVVYKGVLRDGRTVAIKQLTHGNSDDRIGDFLAEVGIMAHVNHPNTAKLIGYGIEGGMFFVLEFSPHGSLASLLHHGSKEKLIWSIRYNVAVGTAEGLLYLHECCRRRIIHRDIKAANILLTEHFEPQVPIERAPQILGTFYVLLVFLAYYVECFTCALAMVHIFKDSLEYEEAYYTNSLHSLDLKFGDRNTCLARHALVLETQDFHFIWLCLSCSVNFQY